MATVNIWGGDVSTGDRDPENPDVVTVSWSVREGVTIERIDVLEGTMIVMRARIPVDLVGDLT